MPLYEPGDAATVLADFGGPVVVRDGDTTEGMLTSAAVAALHFGVELVAGEHVLAVVPGSLGDIRTDQLLTVDGLPFRYRGLFPGPQDLFERHRVAEALE